MGVISVTELIQTLKKAAVEAVEQTKPCTVLFGKVTSDDPLAIRLDTKVVLGQRNVILLSGLEPEEDDVLVLISQKGGGKYVVLGKVG